MENVFIIGASGHAKVIIDIIEKQNKYNIAGIIDNTTGSGESLLGYPIIGKDEELSDLCTKYSVDAAVIAIGDNFQRQQVSNKIKSLRPDIAFIRAIHPTATLGKNAAIADGCIIMAGAIIGADTCIGPGCIINNNSSIDHDSRMGEYSSLAPNVTTGGLVTIGNISAIGISATLSNNVKIGDHTVIGAGSLVLADIPANVIAYGTPAKIIRPRNMNAPYL